MSITVRPLESSDLAAFAQIEQVCFGGDVADILANLQDNPRYTMSHIIVAEVDGQVVGTATMFPAKIWLSGVPLDIGAVASVGVLPDFRKQGVATQMMQTLVSRAATEGYAFTALFPASPQFYNHFDFGVIGDVHAYRFAPSNLINFAEKSKVRPFDVADLPMLRVVYKGQMTWHNGWLSRSNAWWDKIAAKWPHVVVFESDGMLDGYMAYELKTNATNETTLYIKEFFAAEGEALRGLIGYLASQTEVSAIEYLAPPQTPLRHALHQPRTVEAEVRGWLFHDLCHVTSGPMARIITLKTALTKRFYTRHMQGERVIRLNDPLIAQNEAPIIFRLVDGRAETHPAPEGKEVQIETDIRTLTQIIFGYLSATDAQRLGRFKADDDTCSWLDKAIADSPLYIQSGDWF